jgi:hypothetical protein
VAFQLQIAESTSQDLPVWELRHGDEVAAQFAFKDGTLLHQVAQVAVRFNHREDRFVLDASTGE